jgi:hypothetical protein
MAASPTSRAAPLTGPARRALKKKRRFLGVIGVLTAGLLFELGLRPFVADTYHPGPFPVRTIRNYYEGLAVAHFEPDGLGQLGNRLTGNQPVSGAPEVLIVGDSHVAAYSVRDQDTMGAVVERLSRASDQPLNVRQYGWPGANVPTFLAAAGSLLQARHPAWAAVVLNSYNIGADALMKSHDWHMEVASDYSIRLIHGTYLRQTAFRDRLVRWTGRSALALALWRRVGVISSRGTPESGAAATILEQHDSRLAEEAARVPRATVLALKKAFGTRLFIVYAPAVHQDDVEPLETELQSLCAEEGVAFLSVQEALARDRHEHSRLSRGFHNTAPGVGHFNAIGHEIIGKEIWRYLRDRSSSSMPSR